MKDLEPISHNNVVVATTNIVAGYLGASDVNIRQNYNNNKDKFIEGKHYYKLNHDSALKLNVDNIYSGNQGIILWTERGCARHSKLLQTQEAWDLWEDMEDSYFKDKIPHNFADALQLAADNQRKIQELEKQRELDSPKVEFANRITTTSSDESIQIDRYAKVLSDRTGVSIGPNLLRDYLRKEEYLMVGRDEFEKNRPYQRYVKQGMFEEKYINKDIGFGLVELPVTFITGKGQFILAQEIVDHFIERSKKKHKKKS